MKSSVVKLLCALSSFCTLLWAAGPARAISASEELEPAPIGTMEVSRGAGPDRRQSLELQRLDVKVAVRGDVAETSVEHDFFNDSDERLEGAFRFPLPVNAEITGLAMEIDGRMVEGELIERQRAERIYDQIVDEMRDPALLTWEAGNVFKLRVFPIEPTAHKRVVIRYVSPLKTDGKQAQYSFQAQSAQLATRIGHFSFSVDGKTLYDEQKLHPRTIVVDVPRSEAAARVLREVVEGTSYLRVKLPVGTASERRGRGRFRWVVVVDTSRSALEARQLALDTVRAALQALPSGDEFMVLACDIQCRESAGSFSPVGPESAAAALRFLEGIDFDGATDLSAALKRAATRARGQDGQKTGQILYIGDGNPTWGVTDPAELAQALEPALAGIPLHAVIVGKYARPALLTRLSNQGGGVLIAPARKDELAAAARSLAGFGRAARVSDITLSVPDGAILTPSRPASIDAGDELTVFVRTEKGQPPPASLHVRALLDGKAFEKDLPLPAAIPSREVARRFAGSRIRELELEGGHDDQVLALSLEHKVLSSKTAWLVLENDEAYRRHEIERHQKAESADPTVSGKDLESTDGANPSASGGGGEGPEPELWLVLGLALVAFGVRRRMVVAR